MDHETQHRVVDQALGVAAENYAALAALVDRAFSFLSDVMMLIAAKVGEHLECESCAAELGEALASRMLLAQAEIGGVRTVIEATAAKNLAGLQALVDDST
jgi:hypothetical protein